MDVIVPKDSISRVVFMLSTHVMFGWRSLGTLVMSVERNRRT
jgi:hypothetical protein